MARRLVGTTPLVLVAAVAAAGPWVVDRSIDALPPVPGTAKLRLLSRSRGLLPPRAVEIRAEEEEETRPSVKKTSATVFASPGVRILAKASLAAHRRVETARSAASSESVSRKGTEVVDVTLPRQAPVQSVPQVAPGRNAAVIHRRQQKVMAAGTTVSAASAKSVPPPATTCVVNASQDRAVKYVPSSLLVGAVRVALAGLRMAWSSAPAPA